MANKYSGLESFSLSIGVDHAVFRYDKFAKMMGVSRGSWGKAIQDWAKQDQRIWFDKYQKVVGHSLGVSINYLSTENLFFARPEKVNPRFVEFEDKARIFEQTLIGEILREEVEWRVYNRMVDGLGWCFTVALYWTSGAANAWPEKEEFKILCDFPLVATWGNGASEKLDKRMEALGFKVDRDFPVEGHTDEFGDYEHFSPRLGYEKNGVHINLN